MPWVHPVMSSSPLQYVEDKEVPWYEHPPTVAQRVEQQLECRHRESAPLQTNGRTDKCRLLNHEGGMALKP
eukprot:5948665-Pyramimonas_sp.AAC.4